MEFLAALAAVFMMNMSGGTSGFNDTPSDEAVLDGVVVYATVLEKDYYLAGDNGVTEYPEGYEFMTDRGEIEVSGKVFSQYQVGDQVVIFGNKVQPKGGCDE